MSFFRRRRAALRAQNQPQSPDSETGTHFGWEFGPADLAADGAAPERSPVGRRRSAEGAVIDHVPAAPPGTPPERLADLFRGPAAPARVAALRRALDTALERWWAQADLPSLTLLRDGLFALQAGHDLNEAQRTLLLRLALTRGRGILTALKYQTDPVRTAGVVMDALLDPRQPLSPALVQELSRDDDSGFLWHDLLLRSLQQEANTFLEPRRTLARQAVAQLSGARTPAPPAPLPPLWVAEEGSRSRVPAWAAFLLVVALVLLLLGGLYYGRLLRPPVPVDTVTVPAGIYPITDPQQPGQERLVQLQSFRIERTEVTVAAYRRCYELGRCPWPDRSDSATRSDYLLLDQFAEYPMIRTDWAAANAYCSWLGMRLPLEEEWEVAASVASSSMRRFDYPWGSRYQPRFANGADTGVGDTRRVAFSSPAGDSPFGLADMAGNVAEWTATFAEHSGIFIVKGGSYLDGAEELRAGAWRSLPAETREPWLGFRCGATAE